jgi:hypothetical protein
MFEAILFWIAVAAALYGWYRFRKWRPKIHRTGLSSVSGLDGSLSATRTSVDHRRMDGTTITIPIAQVNSVNMAGNGDDWVLTVRSSGNEIVYHGTEREVKEMHTGVLVQQRMAAQGY